MADSPWPSTAVSLIARLVDPSDTEAWSTFSDVYGPLIYRYCRKRGLQDSDSCDVTQEVLQRLIKQMRDFKYDPALGKFRSWLCTLTHNQICDHVKRRDKAGQGIGGDVEVHEIQEPLDLQHWDDEFNATVLEAAIRRVQAKLDEQTWAIFTQLWMEQRKAADVAIHFGKPVGWLYKLKFKILSRLKLEVQYLSADPQ